VLILGSLPGERSLAEQRYYAHPQNRFWHLIGGVIGRELQPLGYQERLAALLEAKVGLWDVVGSATRSGSLDTAIRAAEPNPLADLTASLPHLRTVAFNGGTAARMGTAQLAGTGLTLIPLPSSSPAYASMAVGEKERRWAELREFFR
jgi:hypoxanthine-DNA glycosylase